MTKSEMKKIMKPLVKECLQEMLLEEGLLSSLINEVNKGNKQIFSESTRRDPEVTSPKKQPQQPQSKPQINEVRKKLADSIGKGAYASVFEGLEPAPGPGNLSVDDGDPGMDLSILSNIPGLKGFKWGSMANKRCNVEVKLRQGEHPERMVKRFLNKVKKEKIVEEIQNRKYYETPTAKRSRMKNRRKKVLAKLRREREAKDMPKEKKD